MRCFAFLVAVAMSIAYFASPAAAQNEGLPLLEKATEAKLAATGVNELTNVIKLLDTAFEKGLDKDNTEFAEQLLVGTLVERATALSQLIVDRPLPDPRWQQIRPVIVNDLQRALAINDDQPAANLLLGRMLLLPGGDREAARAALEKVIANEAVDPRTKAEAYIHRGNTKEDPQERLADFNLAVELVPRDAEILRTRAMLHRSENRHAESLADLDAAIEIEPDDSATHEARGLELLMLEKFDDALAAFNKAAELAPDNATPYQNLARALALTGKLDKALDALDKAIELNPAAIPAFLLRAQILLSQGKPNDAMVALDDVLALRPGLVLAVRMKSEILAGTGRLDEAISLLEEIHGPDASDLDTGLQLATYYQVSERSRDAIGIYDRLLAANPENVRLLRSRADAYLNIGEHANAIADYKQAVELAPEDPGILNNLAWVLCTSPKDELRDAARAIELATQAAELTDHKMGHILSTLAAAYAEAGDWENAEKWSAKAVEVSAANVDEDGEPANPEELAQLKKELESYKAKTPWREDKQEAARDAPEEETDAEDDSPVPARTLDF